MATRAKRWGWGSVVLALFLPLPVTAAVADSPAPGTTGISRIVVGANTVTVEGSVAATLNVKRAPVQLKVLPTHDEVTAAPTAPTVASVDHKDGAQSLRFEIPRFGADGRDRYYDKFVVMVPGGAAALPPGTVHTSQTREGDEPFALGDDLVVGGPRYATRLDTPPPNNWAMPTGFVKGLVGVMPDDGEELGARMQKVPILFNDFMYPDVATAGDDAVPYEFEGRQYALRGARLADLDRRIKQWTDDGMDVLAGLVVSTRGVDTDMVHPDATGGTTQAWNTTDQKGTDDIRALSEFFAARYTRNDARYGRVAMWKVGNEVNAQFAWNNMGRKTLHESMVDYERAVRIVHQAVSKYYADPRVFISVDHDWTATAKDDPLVSYRGRDVIDEVNRITKAEGDYAWGVDWHAYPQNLFVPSFWNDTETTDSPDSPVVNFNNLSVLVDHLRQPALEADGLQRHVILSENGFNTTSESTLQYDRVLDTMEQGTDAWSAVENVAAIDDVQSYTPGPGKAFDGNHLLAVTATSVPADQWRTVTRAFAPSVDATSTPVFGAAVASWGIGDNQLETRFVFHSGSDTFTATVPIGPRAWQLVKADLSGWPGRSAIDRVDVSWRSRTVTQAWAGHHFLDTLGFLTEAHKDRTVQVVEDQDTQAAAVALAYYQSFFSGGIDAIFYHREVDAGEAGLKFGLWSNDPARGSEQPLERRRSWGVYQQVDTPNSLAATDFAKKIIGIEDWKELVPNFDPAKLATRPAPTVLPTVTGEAVAGSSIGSFEQGSTEGWRAAENALGVSTSTDAHSGVGALAVTLDPNDKLWKGTELYPATPIDAGGSMSLAVKLAGVTAPGDTFRVKVKLYPADNSAAGGYRWAEGTFLPIGATDGWHVLRLDLGSWGDAHRVGRVKIWVSSTDDRTWWGGTLLVDDVTVGGP